MHGEYPAAKVLSQLRRDNLLPAILFRTSRRQCDVDIDNLANSRGAELSEADSNEIEAEVQLVMAKYGLDREIITNHPHYDPLIRTGCGAHHAGQLLLWRLLLEELMTRSLLRVMIATGTVAAGVDFPARTVVITAHSKRGNEGFNTLTASEFQQMAGRAGRRGKDSVGICLTAPSMFSDARVINEVSKRPAEPLRSAYFAAPSTVLNLLKFRNVDDLKYTVSRSLAAFLDQKAAQRLRDEAAVEEVLIPTRQGMSEDGKKKAHKRVRRQIREAEELESRQPDLLEKTLQGLIRLGHIEPVTGGLTQKGYWSANLCTSLVLELAEAIHEHLFDDLSAPILAGLVASIAGDPHRPYFSLKPNPVPRELFTKLTAVIKLVKETYGGTPVAEATVVPDAALTVITWMEAGDWAEFSGLLRLAGVAEGDVSRLVSQTADHLNQISRLHESHTELARVALEARLKLLKPPLSEAVALAD